MTDTTRPGAPESAAVRPLERLAPTPAARSRRDRPEKAPGRPSPGLAEP